MTEPKPDEKHRIKSIQLELTSRCNLSCKTCLKHDFEQVWQHHDLPETLYQKILADLPDTVESIHLQGWGEPLLVPHIDQYIKEAKKRELQVSFTTNGSIMTEELAEKLVTSGLDAVTFSMAGGYANTQDRLRGNSSFRSLQQSIRQLTATKKTVSVDSPKCAVSYLLTPETVAELPTAVKWCKTHGIDQFSTVHMTQTITREQNNLKLHGNQIAKSHKLLRRRTWMAGLFSAIKIDLRPFEPEPMPMCDKNPLQSIFINSAGDVSPCVFLCPPLKNKRLNWHYNGRKLKQGPFILGNCRESSIEEIWHSSAYLDFRALFQKRVNIYGKAMVRVGYNMDGIQQLDRALQKINNGFSTHPPPHCCTHCYKMDGF